MPKRILEGATQQQRATQRRKLGTLRQLTVQPATRARYDKAINTFLQFLRTNQLTLPTQRQALDPLVCEFLEHLWASGQGRALASDTVAGLQDQDPKLRGQLPGAWRLLKTWSINEIPNRAPPLPAHVLQAMVGWALFHNHFSFAVSLLIGFYGMLRTGEILNIRSSQIYCDDSHSKTIISLGFTKGGKRQGAAESAIIGYDMVVAFISRWKRLAKPSTYLTHSPAHWRGLFNQALTSLKLEAFGFRPYSLRRGGATWWFGRHHSLDKILIQGRWSAPKTARLYINEGLATLAEMKLPQSHPSLTPFLHVFSQHRSRISCTTLEPPCKQGSSGGRGKGKSSKQKVKKAQVITILFQICYSG